MNNVKEKPAQKFLLLFIALSLGCALLAAGTYGTIAAIDHAPEIDITNSDV